MDLVYLDSYISNYVDKDDLVVASAKKKFDSFRVVIFKDTISCRSYEAK